MSNLISNPKTTLEMIVAIFVKFGFKKPKIYTDHGCARVYLSSFECSPIVCETGFKSQFFSSKFYFDLRKDCFFINQRSFKADGLTQRNVTNSKDAWDFENNLTKSVKEVEQLIKDLRDTEKAILITKAFLESNTPKTAATDKKKFKI